jgi:hypothetical protein
VIKIRNKKLLHDIYIRFLYILKGGSHEKIHGSY